jgi:hypothetical protein
LSSLRPPPETLSGSALSQSQRPALLGRLAVAHVRGLPIDRLEARASEEQQLADVLGVGPLERARSILGSEHVLFGVIRSRSCVSE